MGKNKSVEQIINAFEKGATLQTREPVVVTESYYRKIVVYKEEPKEYILSKFEYEQYQLERRRLE